jgi:hypothetical protein
MSKITYVLCSPLHRTLESALLAFSPLLASGMEIVAWDGLREFGDVPCNTGDQLPALRDKMEGHPVNLGLLKEGWETGLTIKYVQQLNPYLDMVKKELYSFCYTLLRGGLWKGMEFSAFNGDGNIEVLIVSHGGLLKAITGMLFNPTHCFVHCGNGD